MCLHSPPKEVTRRRRRCGRLPNYFGHLYFINHRMFLCRNVKSVWRAHWRLRPKLGRYLLVLSPLLILLLSTSTTTTIGGGGSGGYGDDAMVRMASLSFFMLSTLDSIRQVYTVGYTVATVANWHFHCQISQTWHFLSNQIKSNQIKSNGNLYSAVYRKRIRAAGAGTRPNRLS